MLMIAITEIKSHLADETGDLPDLLRVAMRLTRDHWLLANEEAQFRAAVSAVMLHYGEVSEEYKRLNWEIENLKRFQAAITAAQVGVLVDFSGVLSDNESGYQPVGLLELWHEGDLRREDHGQP